MSKLSFDLAHLSVFDQSNVDKEKLADSSYLLSKAKETFIAFFSQLSGLDHESETTVKLPNPVLEIPREKPLPAEKPKTRWEKFVEQKDLKFEKKEKKEFDEKTGEWKLRYGYKRANDPNDQWLIEVPNDSTQDPFEKLSKDKKQRVQDQEKRERRNKKRAARAVAELSQIVSVKNKEKLKNDAKKAIALASHPSSSASMNQFNKVKNKVGIFEEGSQVPKIFNRNKGQKKSK